VVRHGENDGFESSLEAAVVAVRPAQAGTQNLKLNNWAEGLGTLWLRVHVMTDDTNAADAQLVAACLQGDSRAWEALLRRYRRLIYSIPRKYGLSPDDAADVFQSVCIALLEAMSGLRDETKISSWLITTTIRECWKVIRRQRQEVAISLSDDDEDPGIEIVSDGQPLDEVIQAWQEQQLIRQGVEQLDQRCKTLLTYLFYEKEAWSYQQISQDLRIPASSIGPTRGRCLDKLKRILKNLGFS
jgi:RNA polymerase sigma factor (sigma-70 family)